MPVFPFAQQRFFALLGGALGSVAVALAGCGEEVGPGEVEQVVLHLAAVPQDVACLRLTASGPGRSVVRLLEAVPGTPLSETFSGLPLGSVRFGADAFQNRCEEVTRSSIPAWTSDPQTVNVALGRLSSVSLTMVRNGRAKVAVDFVDDLLCAGGEEGACAGGGADAGR